MHLRNNLKMLTSPSFTHTEFSPVLKSNSTRNSLGLTNSYKQPAKYLLSIIIIFTNNTTLPVSSYWYTIFMQEMATKASFSRSLITTFVKISIHTKYFKLFLDIGTAIVLMSHKKKENSVQLRAGRIMKREKQRERYGLHSPTLKQDSFFFFFFLNPISTLVSLCLQ